MEADHDWCELILRARNADLASIFRQSGIPMHPMFRCTWHKIAVYCYQLVDKIHGCMIDWHNAP